MAVVVPDRSYIEKWAHNNGIQLQDDDKYEGFLNTDPRVNWVITTEIQTICKNSGLFGFEIPQRVFLTSKVFSQESGLLTPTYKVKRNEAKHHFLREIKAMYEGANL